MGARVRGREGAREHGRESGGQWSGVNVCAVIMMVIVNVHASMMHVLRSTGRQGGSSASWYESWPIGKSYRNRIAPNIGPFLDFAWELREVVFLFGRGS